MWLRIMSRTIKKSWECEGNLKFASLSEVLESAWWKTFTKKAQTQDGININYGQSKRKAMEVQKIYI